MTKKMWKLKTEAVDFILSVCPTHEKGFEILTKAETIFNADQDVAAFTIASLNPGEILECKATLKLWRDECAELIEVDDFKAPWELSKEELKDLCEDDAEADDETDDSEDEGDCNVDDRKRVNVHVVFVGKGKASDSEKKDSE